MTIEELVNLIRLLPEPQLRRAEELLKELSHGTDTGDAFRLGGLWAGYRLTDADICGVRNELWGGLHKRLGA